jgi:hypothetical protein
VYGQGGAVDPYQTQRGQLETVGIRVQSSEPTRTEYHTWYFLATLDSADRWQQVVRVDVNASSGTRISLPDNARKSDVIRIRDKRAGSAAPGSAGRFDNKSGSIGSSVPASSRSYPPLATGSCCELRSRKYTSSAR